MSTSFRPLPSHTINPPFRSSPSRCWFISPLPLLLLSPLICLLTLLFRTFPPSPFAIRESTSAPRANSTSPALISDPISSTRCILYDRPPHTASTTLSEALTACLATREYTHTPYPYDLIPEDSVVSNLVSQPSHRRSATMKHLQISAEDIIALRSTCPYLLYVTSTRSMPGRIISSAKYVQTKGHGDSNLTHAQMERAMDVALGDKNNERRLEHYPFSSDMRLLPHYVVRHESFRADFAALLEALNCDPNFPTKNVHEHRDDKDEALETATSANITLHYGDARHRNMMALAAERNAQGLRLAQMF